MADGLLQIRHLHRRQRRLESLVAHLQPGTVDRLLQRVAGKDTERMRHSCLLRRLPDPARDYVDDYVEVGCVSAQKAAEADDSVVLLGFSKCARGQGDFEGARDADDLDVFLFRPGTNESIVCAAKQAVGDEFVESRDDDSETKPRGIQLSRARLLPNLLIGRFLCVPVSL